MIISMPIFITIISTLITTNFSEQSSFDGCFFHTMISATASISTVIIIENFTDIFPLDFFMVSQELRVLLRLQVPIQNAKLRHVLWNIGQYLVNYYQLFYTDP